jgi:hypothetical protein
MLNVIMNFYYITLGEALKLKAFRARHEVGLQLESTLALLHMNAYDPSLCV